MRLRTHKSVCFVQNIGSHDLGIRRLETPALERPECLGNPLRNIERILDSYPVYDIQRH